MEKIETTLCILKKENQILLAMKKRGFGTGKYNGVGEKIENGFFHLYLVYDWEGIPTESEEMNPKWFSFDEIPYSQMFPDDTHWLPLVLEGKKVNAYFKYDEYWNLLEKK